jgi:hypothetical protein
MDVQWAIWELKQFVEMTALKTEPRTGLLTGTRSATVAASAEIVPAAQVVEQILDRVVSGWRSSIAANVGYRWAQMREASQRAIAQLERADEIAEKLGEAGPNLRAGALHPWVWESARSLWQSGYYTQAVSAAAIKLNAEAQIRVRSRERSETDLFNVVFSQDREPKRGNPRFILPDDEGGKTAESVRRGVRAFAEGCYAALRNPLSHDPDADLPEHEALEQLAAFSILARWVESSEVRFFKEA